MWVRLCNSDHIYSELFNIFNFKMHAIQNYLVNESLGHILPKPETGSVSLWFSFSKFYKFSEQFKASLAA